MVCSDLRQVFAVSPKLLKVYELFNSNQTLIYLGQSIPFRFTFKTNENENTVGANANDADDNEQNGTPGGIVGFSLNYEQQSC